MSSKDENEKQNKLLNNDNNANAKNKKPIPIPKKQQRKKKMRIKTFCQNTWETLKINCLKNTVTVKILTVL